MAIEAPVSKFRKNNLKIYIGVCLLAGVVFAYDGYLSRYKWSKRYNFYKEQVLDNDGVPSGTMQFNRYSPPFFFLGALLLGGYLVYIKNKKIVADEKDLILCNGNKIPYDVIQKIDKTWFDSKGFFILTYKTETGTEVDRKFTDKGYENLKEVMDLLVAKIS